MHSRGPADRTVKLCAVVRLGSDRVRTDCSDGYSVVSLLQATEGIIFIVGHFHAPWPDLFGCKRSGAIIQRYKDPAAAH